MIKRESGQMWREKRKKEEKMTKGVGNKRVREKEKDFIERQKKRVKKDKGRGREERMNVEEY